MEAHMHSGGIRAAVDWKEEEQISTTKLRNVEINSEIFQKNVEISELQKLKFERETEILGLISEIS